MQMDELRSHRQQQLQQQEVVLEAEVSIEERARLVSDELSR